MEQSLFARLYEGLDICGSYQPVVEYFEFTNIKAFKAFFSKTKKVAQDYTRTANSLFRKGDYKEAKNNYQNALKNWKAVQSAVKQVEEKEPGWFKSDNLVYFIPFVNLAATLLLAHAESSALRYIPKFVARNDNANKGNEYHSGSITKADIVAVINEVISYCEFQIKVCDKPEKVALAESVCDMMESFAAIADNTERMLESYELFQ